MGNLLDMPPVPFHGDPDPEITWAVVGRALTDWKKLELYLARVHAIALGVKPIIAIACPE